MADAPEIRIVGGSPTPLEEAAAREAIMRLWSEDQAAAARAAGPNPWVLAGRVEGARQGGAVLRGSARAWRLSGRVAASPQSHIGIGRGDAR